MPATITAPSYRVGVDIGGTFTDVVVAASDGGRGVRKLLSTPPDIGRAVIAGVRAALADLGAEAGARSEVVHATTVVTNAILERKGARCAVITTEGFRDVLEGISHPVLNQRNIPVEVIEVENPLRVRRYGFVPDTGGAGKFRGGLSLMRDFEFVGAEPAQLQMRADRRVTRPYGLAGGQAGSPSCNLMAPGTKKERELPAMVTTTIAPGETVRFMTAGGGGWGDPRERDPQAVAEDVADGKMTPAHARAVWYRRRCGGRDSAAQERFAPESGRGR